MASAPGIIRIYGRQYTQASARVPSSSLSLIAISCLLILVAGCGVVYVGGSSSQIGTTTSVKAGYWPAYAADFAPLSSVDTRLFTHLLYAFLEIDENNFTVGEAPTDLVDFSSTLRRTNPQLKTLVSIGGGDSNKTTISRMVASKVSRKAFIDSSIALAREYQLDGIDLDWEFPDTEQDMNNLGSFFSEWRVAVQQEAKRSNSIPPLLLTAAVYYSSSVDLTDLRRYPISSIASNLDWVHIMAFDYHGYWDETETGEHTALFDPNSNLSTTYGLGQWLEAGLPQQKAVVGLAAYGKSWLLKSKDETGIGAPAIGSGPPQHYSQKTGEIYFFEVESLISSLNATVVFDNTTASAYCFAGDVWMGYDDAISIASKVKYLAGKGIRGYFFWAVSFDDRNRTLSSQAFKTWDAYEGEVVSPSPSPPTSGESPTFSKFQFRILFSLMVIVTSLF